jgi:metallo-beta-lactamase family protein
MKITFHGAARTVTGSKHLITLNNGKKILLDCGLFQGLGKESDVLNKDFGFDPTDIDVMVLSHAHIDHCGLVPKLVKDGYNNKIWCTPATRDLAAILLEDSGGIQESEAKYVNKKRANEGRPYIDPLYTEEDAKAAIPYLEPVDYHQWFTILDGVEVMFTDAGHIIGSACVHLRIAEEGKATHITFSGDVGRYRDAILRSPETFPQADYILLESTYGNRLHDEMATSPDALLDWITKTCLQKKGKLIIPAFSVGRTQELLYTLNQLELENRLPAIDYIVDSPLSSEATAVVKSHPENFNLRLQKILQSDNDPFSFKGLKFTKTVEESKLLNFRKAPCVIISASGMADAGRVKHHISNNIENSRNTILLVGYCEPHSLGGRLKLKPEEVNIFGIPHEVHAEIGEMKSMSAHGDYNDLFQYLGCQDPQQVSKVFLVHGEYDVQQDFKEKLIRKGFTDVAIPAQHQTFDL